MNSGFPKEWQIAIPQIPDYQGMKIARELFFFCFGFQGHHFMVASLPYPPYTYMNPTGFTADGSMKYEITGYFPEVFHNLQVSYAL